jgi:hypothetical protein
MTATVLPHTRDGLAFSIDDGSALRTGRFVGVALIVLMAASSLINFSLEGSLFGTPGFLLNAAPHSQQVGFGAVLGMLAEMLYLGIAVAMFPVVSRRSQRMAVWLVAFAAVVLAAAVAESASVMSMVSLSQKYATASAADREQLQTIRVVVSGARNWVHYLARALDGGMILAVFVVLYRFALVPRILAAAGIGAAALMIVIIGRTLFGYEVIFPLLAPVGVAELALALWLIVKGLADGGGARTHPR